MDNNLIRFRKKEELKRMMSKAVKLIYQISFLAILLVVFNSYNVSAQGDDDPDNPGGGGDPDLPIDGGASILIAAGVAYGIKKVYDKRKQHKETDID